MNKQTILPPSIIAVMGGQWGDEAKAKIAEFILSMMIMLGYDIDLIFRYQGGPNAGHTLEDIVLHQIPAGILNSAMKNLMGAGMVINPIAARSEINLVSGKAPNFNLMISKGAFLILPTHIYLDIAREGKMGKKKIGSTQKGITPAYEDKAAKRGIRVGDILRPGFKDKYDALVERHAIELKQLGFAYPEDFRQIESEFFSSCEYLVKTFKIVDDFTIINESLLKGKHVLAEGAQAGLLNLTTGYPYSTSSYTGSNSISAQLDIPSQWIKRVFVVAKGYATRVGSGPFNTEAGGVESAIWCDTNTIETETKMYPSEKLFDKNGFIKSSNPFEIGIGLRRQGKEYGATTKRLRRCGFLDLPALKYVCARNGATDIALTKSDVLSCLHEVPLCVAYEDGHGVIVDYDPDRTDIIPVYKQMPTWSSLEKMSFEEEFPREFLRYINKVEEIVGLPVSIVSTGPRREQTILRKCAMAALAA